jgi:hypothetical protein
LIVTGGVGITGNITAGGSLQAPGRAILGSSTTSNVVVAATTTSTSTTTGALVVAGGIGTAGNINTTSSITAARVNNTGQFYYNTRTISANVTIDTTENAMSVGPITIADGVEVVIADGGEWSIV